MPELATFGYRFGTMGYGKFIKKSAPMMPAG
ncbi:hypothetical protein OIHEL45_00005, partial [Sulfitobacter indolifex HEL-45]